MQQFLESIIHIPLSVLGNKRFSFLEGLWKFEFEEDFHQKCGRVVGADGFVEGFLKSRDELGKFEIQVMGEGDVFHVDKAEEVKENLLSEMQRSWRNALAFLAECGELRCFEKSANSADPRIIHAEFLRQFRFFVVVREIQNELGEDVDDDNRRNEALDEELSQEFEVLEPRLLGARLRILEIRSDVFEEHVEEGEDDGGMLRGNFCADAGKEIQPIPAARPSVAKHRDHHSEIVGLLLLHFRSQIGRGRVEDPGELEDLVHHEA